VLQLKGYRTARPGERVYEILTFQQKATKEPDWTAPAKSSRPHRSD
jgi:hypothetical protein